jgi:hypothetical protein
MTSVRLPLFTTAHVSTEPARRGYSKMSTRRRERSQAPSIESFVVPSSLAGQISSKQDAAPVDGAAYVQKAGVWSELAAQWQQGAVYVDGVAAVYSVYDTTGSSWVAYKNDTAGQTTTGEQSTTKPTSLSAVKLLTYSEAGGPQPAP